MEATNLEVIAAERNKFMVPLKHRYGINIASTQLNNNHVQPYTITQTYTTQLYFLV